MTGRVLTGNHKKSMFGALQLMPLDERFMREALKEAWKAEDTGEVPAGAVVVSAAGEIIGRAGNGCAGLNDPTAHAEVLALRQAAVRERNYRLPRAEVFTTLEPCPMCLAAMIHARVSRVVYGAAEPRWGACGSLMSLAELPGLNHRIQVQGGLLARECRELIQGFFKKRRGTEVVVTGATRNRLVGC